VNKITECAKKGIGNDRVTLKNIKAGVPGTTAGYLEWVSVILKYLEVKA